MNTTTTIFAMGFRKKAHGIVLASALAGLGFFASQAQAATSTGNLAISGTITATCTVGAGSLAFGAFNPTLNTNLDVSGTFTVTCTNATPYVLSLNAGLGTGATTTTRKMTSGANLLNYNIFQNTTRTTNFGNTSGTDTLAGTGSGIAQTITAYGRIPAQTTAAVGVYSDTVTITVTY